MQPLIEINAALINKQKYFRYKKTFASLSPMSCAEKKLADAVVARLDCKDERFKNVMTSLIRNLHTFVSEVEPSEDEW